jgi:hypothetical protein
MSARLTADSHVVSEGIARNALVCAVDASKVRNRRHWFASQKERLRIAAYPDYPFVAFRLPAQYFFIRSLTAFRAASLILRRRRRRTPRLTVSTGAD